ncbi:rhomboid family intramembrane serine protease [Solitalea sp. MAHUQ-68]|uniref:Rhomboid family intramembrane serine protease n=1 Tax=Solitalea agri TaxID=2953739 RepID=A0A9X2JDE9_9SPHI|nr:rhomboid family intramembrane serine protease [Solitalea agri]MCO4292840.1 rhomboid family intramembrane serine protease [Solitalea agri]
MQEILQTTPVAAIIFAFTVLTSAYGLFFNHDVNSQFSLHPYSINRGSRYYTVFTSGLIHADLGHLLFNMLTFYFFAFPLEQIFVMAKGPAGHWWFAGMYVLALVLSDISTIIKQKNNIHYYSLGASGAISAVLFSMILFMPQMKISMMFIPIGIPAYIFGPLYLAYCVYASRNHRDNVNHDAHFYGAVAGLLFTIILFPGIFSEFVGQLIR